MFAYLQVTHFQQQLRLAPSLDVHVEKTEGAQLCKVICKCIAIYIYIHIYKQIWKFIYQTGVILKHICHVAYRSPNMCMECVHVCNRMSASILQHMCAHMLNELNS